MSTWLIVLICIGIYIALAAFCGGILHSSVKEEMTQDTFDGIILSSIFWPITAFSFLGIGIQKLCSPKEKVKVELPTWWLEYTPEEIKELYEKVNR